MLSEILSRYKYYVVVFILFTSVQMSGQSKIYLFGMGGINYIPMKNFSHFLHQLSNEKIDEVGFNGSFGIKYFLSENQSVSLSAEVINKNASYSGGFSGAIWNFKVIPIGVGYQYLFSDAQSSFCPFVGLNASYSFIEIRGQNYSDNPPKQNDFVKKNTIGIEPNIGFSYRIVERYYLLTELKYRAVSDIVFWNKDVNFSGLIWNVGVQINIL